jgi:organic radical activating enzyme
MKEDIFENGLKLPLIEEFYTVQGEGYHMGKPAYFIRLGGCDIACNWCDTKISWRADKHKLAKVERIAESAERSGAGVIVVTGGEPTSYNLMPLCNELTERNIDLHIETSGAYPLTGEWDWICLSPKKQQPPEKTIFKLANELKVIIFDEEDFEWAEECAKQVNQNCKLYLQPEWSRQSVLTQKVVEYVKQNTKWSISIQAHKFMKIP